MSEELIKDLIKIEGIGETKAQELIKAGVSKVSDLRLKKYAGLLSTETLLSIKYPISKQLTWDYVDSLVTFLQQNASKTLTGVGSYRRQKALINDIDLITTTPLNKIMEAVKGIRERLLKNGYGETSFDFIGEYSSGPRKQSVVLKYKDKYVRVDFFKITPEEKPYALLHYTGSQAFNIRVRAQAKRLGYKLNQYGLYRLSDNELIPCKTERDVLKAIEVTYKSPPLRSE